MQVFMAVNEGKGVSVLVGQVVSAFSLLNNYIEELGIEKQLKGMEAVQLMQKYGRT